MASPSPWTQQVGGSPMLGICLKLKRLKPVLKYSNQQFYSDISIGSRLSWSRRYAATEMEFSMRSNGTLLIPYYAISGIIPLYVDYNPCIERQWKGRRFHAMKTEWGFPQLLPLSTFTDAANGYLVRDTCVFGAEVFVVSYTGRGECLNIMEDIYHANTRTWKIENFSSLHERAYSSDVFTVGNRKWYGIVYFPLLNYSTQSYSLTIIVVLMASSDESREVHLYPKGDREMENDKFLSLYFKLSDSEAFPSGRSTYAKYKLRILNQYNSNHVERGGTRCFCAPNFIWGYPAMLSLTDLEDATKGFLVNDTLLIEAEVSAISAVNNLSNRKTDMEADQEKKETDMELPLRQSFAAKFLLWK
ncbi:hypothetical protein Vadar_016382 [Vaccinium darrowii]|uniref:Uncharacterized protein n=1 Tax=Vaccinium darrowii TaxID=229202 RepID=A0ACB7X1E7_9ERIC|nr:hypothetical protein Vadar_016382 [Vaccinium darrowii]